MVARPRYIAKIDVAFRSVRVPLVHRVNCFDKLDVVCDVDTANINPEVSQPISSSLIPTEFNLLVTRLIGASPFHDIFEGDLLGVQTPYVRQYGILRYIVTEELLRKAECSLAVGNQEAHISCELSDKAHSW